MEQTKKWKVVSTGKIKDGFFKDDVVSNLQKLFKINEIQTLSLINGTAIDVKKDLSHAKASQYMSILEENGLQVLLESMPLLVKPDSDGLSLLPLESEAKSNESTLAKANIVSDIKPLSDEEMECPKCHKRQHKAITCVHCGIIINRFLEKREQAKRGKTTELTSDGRLFNHGQWPNGKNILMGLMLIVALLLVKNFLWDGHEFQEQGNSAEALAQIEAVEKANKHPKPAPAHLRKLLQSGRYSEVESILSELRGNSQIDISWEQAFTLTFGDISPKNQYRPEILDKWVESTHSGYAYMARGSYYYNAASLARGEAYLSKTSESQITAMNKLNKKAYKDLLKARSIDQSLLPVYSLLIGISGFGSIADIPIDTYLNEGVSVNPGGYYYRYQYMRVMMPKWGGSWRKMQNFADATEPYLSKNPRLWLLQGFIPAEKGYLALQNKSYGRCVKLFSEALQYGKYSKWLYERAYCLSWENEYEQALRDVKMSLEMNDDADARQLKRFLESKI